MPPDVSRRRAVAAVVVLSFAAFAFVTTELLPIGLLTLIAPDLERSRSEIGLLVTGYAAVVFLASVPLTALTQRIPRRRLLGATMVVFTAATAASALAGSYWQLAGARLLTALTQALFWSVVASTTTGLSAAGSSPASRSARRSRRSSACPPPPGSASRPAGGRRSR
jgi:predicted MFS family arabinose efflux permease